MPVIGKGAYGCVINPPLELINATINKPYTNKKGDDVSKLFTGKDRKKNYEKEIEELKEIASYDKNNSFTVPYKGAMYGKYNKTDDSITICITPDKNGDIYQIILGNGGKDLDKIKCDIDYLDFLHILKKFIEGIETLGQKGKVHQDIKPPNVLLNCTDKKLNLIDFGISINIEDTYKEYSEFLTSLYAYHPPDYLIVSKIFQCADNVSDLLDVLYHLMDSLDTEIPDNSNNVIKKLYYDYYLFYIENKYNNTDALKTYFYNQLSQYIATVIYMIENNYVEDNIDAKSIKRAKLISFLYDKVFTNELSLKIDIYPIAFIILELMKKVKDDTTNKIFINQIFTKCVDTNPFTRISATDLIQMINKEQHTHLMYTQHSVTKRQRINGGRRDVRKILTKKQDIFLDIDKDINEDIQYSDIKLNAKNNKGILKLLDIKPVLKSPPKSPSLSTLSAKTTPLKSSLKVPKTSTPKSPPKSPSPSILSARTTPKASPKSPLKVSPKSSSKSSPKSPLKVSPKTPKVSKVS